MERKKGWDGPSDGPPRRCRSGLARGRGIGSYRDSRIQRAVGCWTRPVKEATVVAYDCGLNCT